MKNWGNRAGSLTKGLLSHEKMRSFFVIFKTSVSNVKSEALFYISNSSWSLRCSVLIFGILLGAALMRPTLAATATLVPNGDVTTQWAVLNGADDGTCAGGVHCDYVDEGVTPNDADYIGTGTNGSGGEIEEFDLTSPPAIASATSLSLRVRYTAASIGGNAADTLAMQLVINGTAYSASSSGNGSSGGWTDGAYSFSGSWSQADVDSMRVRITRTVQGGGPGASRDDDIRISNIYANLTYTQSVTYNQSSYRWFNNSNNVEGISWYNTSWQNRRKITLDNSASTENLVNFPIRVSLNSTKIDYTKTQDAGQDIRFVDADGTTLLSHEIETWNEAGTSEVWVKVPQVDAGSTTDHIYIYYNNTGAADGQNAASVWNSNFDAVWHMKENPTATQPAIKDSTVAAKHGTASGMASGRQVSGKINGALEFDGLDGIIATTADSIPTTATYEAWMRYDSAGEGGLGRILHKGTTTTSSYLLTDYVTGRELIFKSHRTTTAGEWRTPANSVPDDGQLHHIVVTYDNSSTTNVPNVYIDGVSVALTTITTPAGSPILNAEPWHIGNNSVGDRTADGVIDEVRISNTLRSPEWVEAQYRTMANNMNTYSTEELSSYPVPGTPLADQNTDATITAGSSFRLRQLLEQTAGSTKLDAGSYKMQYAAKSGICDPTFSSEIYQDVYVPGGSISDNTVYKPGAAYTDSISAWLNETNAGAQDGLYASASNDAAISVGSLAANNFGFAIPSNATITGIEARVVVNSDFGSNNTASIFLSKNGVASTDLADSAAWNTSETILVYGGSTELWGTSWTPADINSSTFALSMTPSPDYFNQYTVNIDSMQLKVHYSVEGQSTSQTLPSSAASTDNGFGSSDWSSINAAFTEDGVEASATSDGIYDTDYLVTSNYGFSIPSNATIIGIKARVKMRKGDIYSLSSGESSIVKNGVIGTTIIANTDEMPETSTYKEFGNPTNLWGESFTPTDINNPNFGLAYAVPGNGSAMTNSIAVDAVQLQVYYSAPVDTGAPIAYHTTTGIASATSISTHANDPTATGAIRPQTFVSADPFSNSVSAVAYGESAMWDFAVSTTAEATGSYCFRVVKEDGSLLSGYSQIPEITIAGGGGGGPSAPTLDQQVRGGQSVVNGVKAPFSW